MSGCDDMSDEEDKRLPSLIIVPPSGPVTAHALRLRPGEPLMSSLRSAADVILARYPPEKCSSVFVVTAVGSLKDATLRLANASKKDTEANVSIGTSRKNNNGGESLDEAKGNDIRRWKQRFEIVSLVGTFSRDGGCHLHISLSDSEGRTIGGHLIDGDVFTTVEVVLGTADGVSFVREHDRATGYRELVPLQLRTDKRGAWFQWGKQILTSFLLGIAVGSIMQLRK